MPLPSPLRRYAKSLLGPAWRLVARTWRARHWWKKRRVFAYKAKLAAARHSFSAHPDILFVFQVFNKAQLAHRILEPFLAEGVENIVVFADGCIDGSAESWHRLTPGPRHFVISANDTHEIHNYRLSLRIGAALSCTYVVLLQDDDLYDRSLFEWLAAAKRLARAHRAAIVGGNTGGNLDPAFKYAAGDAGLSTAEFFSGRDGEGRSYYQLGHYERWFDAQPTARSTDGQAYCFAASVNRAPQLIEVAAATELNFFPAELEPYQYDDYYNCFASWLSGRAVLLAPVPSKRTAGEGGMRLYNNVTVRSRPGHFANNWNVVLDRFQSRLSDIAARVQEANYRHAAHPPDESA